MPVYVDDAFLPYGRMRMSHMMADSTEELIAMAEAVGVNRRWIQKPGTRYEHFDVCTAARAKALTRGAIAVSRRELVERIRQSPSAPSRAPPPPQA